MLPTAGSAPRGIAQTLATVIVADPHPAMAAAVLRLLEKQPGLAAIAQANDRASATRLLNRYRPDVLIVDPVILEDGGLRTLELLRRASPSTQVVLVSMNDQAMWARALATTGGVEYLAKDSAAGLWVSAVRSAAERRRQGP